ncbi:MAG: DUF268 domain-containing protein [Deltaproteobacteria bacterium]|nr:DUF268 domain-containing protein [Deltaproteobacteria bacterium]
MATGRLRPLVAPWLSLLRQLVAASPLRWPGLPREMWRFLASHRDFRRLAAESGAMGSGQTRFHPALFDRDALGFDAHYTFQAAWATRRIVGAAPPRHVDVSSDHRFVTQLASCLPVLYVEFRPVPLGLAGLETRQGDVTALPFQDQSIPSLSCLHVVEHVGLGRYGDPLDPLGHMKACRELQRVLAPGGMLLLSVPVGRSGVWFNAHRVLDPASVAGLMPELRLVEFCAVTGDGRYVEHANPPDFRSEEYACGMYRMTR